MKNRSKNKILLSVLLVFFVVILSLFLINLFWTNGETAVITQDKKILYKINLSEVKEEYEIAIRGNRGIVNTVLVKPFEIGIIHADCPDKVCVKTGFIKNGTTPIICLPNRLEIKIINDNSGLTDVVTR
ncbi:MAG: NusG domain II-containing protein [Eubacterium sp.]|jgi:hypothetical protein|nr:NusG domain II-containing protein [Eubacterium sp.]